MYRIVLSLIFLPFLVTALGIDSICLASDTDSVCQNDMLFQHFFNTTSNPTERSNSLSLNDKTDASIFIDNSITSICDKESQSQIPQQTDSFTKKAIGGISNFFKKIQNAISQGGTKAGEKIKTFSQLVTQSTTKVGSKALNGLKETTQIVGDKVKGFTKSFVNNANQFGNKAKSIVSISDIKEKALKLKEKIKNMPKAVKDGANSVGDKMKNLPDSIINGLKNIQEKTKDTSSSISQKVSQAGDTIKDIPSCVGKSINTAKEETKRVILMKFTNGMSTIEENYLRVKRVLIEGAQKLREKCRNISSAVAENFQKIKEKSKKLIPSNTSQRVANLTINVKEAFIHLFNKTKDLGEVLKLRELKDNMKGALSKISNKTAIIGEKLKIGGSYLSQKKDQIIETVKDKGGKFQSKLKNTYDSLKGGLYKTGSVVMQGIGFIGFRVYDVIWKIGYCLLAILVLYLYRQIHPFISVFFPVFTSLFKWGNKKNNVQQIIVAAPPATTLAVKFNKEDFDIKSVSLSAQKVPQDVSSCFLRFNLYYEISRFPSLKGHVLLKFNTFYEDTLKHSNTFKLHAEEFTHKSTWNGCSFETVLNASVEDVTVKLFVDFNSDCGQYLSIYSHSFGIRLQ